MSIELDSDEREEEGFELGIHSIHELDKLSHCFLLDDEEIIADPIVMVESSAASYGREL